MSGADVGGELKVQDVPERWPVEGGPEEHFAGRVISVRSDRVVMPDGTVATRDYVRHPGSVAAIAIDDQERVLLLRQYRHPAGYLLWEAPAGIRDVAGEPLAATAARELEEETGWRAATWHTLVDVFTSPGMSDERVRVFLARDLTEIPAAEQTYVRRNEEIDMPLAWVPLREAVARVFAGDIANSLAVMGILAAYTASADGFTSLRAADAPEH
ncbi:NUDIX domain-containing protein [Bailinhaonella thermotolerans]|uniref:NUDIX hydrolase n=1 Tax=Bailinhaonella thermotolerans TaxID=1070861 RepID=A0A3A4AGE4_9ACTN|nr:NUDIX hydrolase [Bailinhaonella thermotolerans]RJL24743.1 NUDIX hydrolase [Bailinhaonella thermotolerans]